MTGIELYSTTAANNNSASPNGFPEGMPPSGVNDSARQVMASIREWYESAEWINLGHTPTYIGATQFSVPTDLTTTYQVGRRIRAVGTTPFTIYGTISVSAFASVTTVTVVWDSGSLNSTLTAVSVGSASVTNKSIGTAAISGFPFTAASSATPAYIDFAEDTDNGTNRVRLIAPASIAADVSVNLPGTADTLVGRDTTDTLTNKTLTSPVINTGITGSATGLQLQSISASVAASALTISAPALSLEFRSATLGSGTLTRVSGTPANLVISSGSTLGTVNAVQSRIAVLAINNAGTIELAAVNIAGGNDLSETGLISTTAEGGAGAADSANVVYSTTARSNVAYRVIGYIESTQATAGTWATTPSTIQGAGGNAFQAMSSLGYGQTWQTGLTRASGTTYYNTTGKPIYAYGYFSQTSVASAAVRTVSINGGSAFNIGWGFSASTLNIPYQIIIPVGASYVYTDTNVSSLNNFELR
jgi:hypothetical protein